MDAFEEHVCELVPFVFGVQRLDLLANGVLGAVGLEVCVGDLVEVAEVVVAELVEAVRLEARVRNAAASLPDPGSVRQYENTFSIERAAGK